MQEQLRIKPQLLWNFVRNLQEDYTTSKDVHQSYINASGIKQQT